MPYMSNNDKDHNCIVMRIRLMQLLIALSLLSLRVTLGLMVMILVTDYHHSHYQNVYCYFIIIKLTAIVILKNIFPINVNN